MNINLVKAQYSPESDIQNELQYAEAELQPPSMYQVLMLNDDYTPMDFVVGVLEDFFAMNREKATAVMLTIHRQGQALCGTYTRDIAESKAMQVTRFARDCEHPLQCEIKRAE